MANELTITGQILDNLINTAVGITSVNFTQTGNPPRCQEGKITVTTSESAIPLGALASATLGWCIFINLDTTNYVEIRVGTGGTKYAKIPPGGVHLSYFGSGVTAPYIIANTATCLVRYKIMEA